MYDNVTIILQGIIIPDVDLIYTLSQYIKVANIILSIYDSIGDNSCISEINNLYPNVRIIYNNYEEYKNDLMSINKFTDNSFINNCYYQIRSSKKALDIVTTEYIVKSKVDHFYSALADGDMIKWCIDHNKILSSSIYVRSYNCEKYHLSDHLFIGKTVEIKNVFSLALLNYSPGCPESNIWKYYIFDIAKKEGVNLDSLDCYEYAKYMASKFYIYCINRNEHYRVKIGGTIYNKINDIDKTTDDSTNYFLYGCDFN
jgi:hypothetical protein